MAHWSLEPKHRFLDYVRESDRVLHLSIDGIRAIKNMVPLVELLHDSEQQLARTREDAQFAEVEAGRDFPLLHAHTLVGAWGALEAAVEDLVVAVLRNDPAVRGFESISRIKISLTDFESADAEERMRIVVTELQRVLRSEQRLGVNAFEAVLDQIGLGGPVSADTNRDLFELQQVRHAVVHRGSVADRRLVERCPWLGLSSGQRIEISHRQYAKLMTAMVRYFLDVTKRATDRYAPSEEAGRECTESSGNSDSKIDHST